MLRYSGSFVPTENMIKAIEYCETCLDICEMYFLELNHQERYTISIKDERLKEQIKKAQNVCEIEEIARANFLLDEMYNKRLLKYLLMDFCIYIGQSISNIKQFNPQIAFCLARKPFCETLCYLEKMLLNPEETVKLVFSDNARDKDIDNRNNKGINSKETYYEVLKILKLDGDKETIYSMRYAKDVLSIRAIGDKASHIATSGTGIKVESGELNFIFIEDSVIADFTKLYCKILPRLMHYVVCVVKHLFNKISSKEIDLKEFNKTTDEFFGKYYDK